MLSTRIQIDRLFSMSIGKCYIILYDIRNGDGVYLFSMCVGEMVGKGGGGG